MSPRDPLPRRRLRLRPCSAAIALALSLPVMAAGASAVSTPASALRARQPASIVVGNCNDSGPGSLREAVAGAVSGDMIDLGGLACSTITLSSGQIEIPQDDLYIKYSPHGGARPAIEANLQSRVFHHTGHGTLKIADLAIRDGKYDNIYNIRASYNDEALRIAKEFDGMGLHRVGVVAQNDAFGQAGLRAIQEAVKQYPNMKLVWNEAVERNSIDVHAAVAKIASEKVDLVYVVSTYATTAELIKKARGAGYVGVFSTLSFVGAEPLAQSAGAAAQGVMIPAVMPSPHSEPTTLSSEYRKAIGHSNPNGVYSYASMEGYVAARVMVEALKRINGPVMPEAIDKDRPFPAGDLLLAVEVTSPSSRSLDRIIKPAALAEAGVPHYWRADIEGQPYIEVYELDGQAYRLAHTLRAGTATRLERPFPVEVDPAILVRAAH